MKSAHNRAGSRLTVELTPDGVRYGPSDVAPPQDWYLDAGNFPGQEDILSFVAQLEESGYARPSSSGSLMVPWRSVYWALGQDDVSATQRELPVPEIDPLVVPALKSTGTLTDPNFQILVSGWHRRDGGQLADRLSLVGPVATPARGTPFTLGEPVFELLAAVREFSRRSPNARDAHQNKLAWGRIRELAVDAGAVLDQFLKKTVILRPSMLQLSMERVHAGEDIAVHVSPTFENAPNGWLDAFDRERRTDLFKLVDDQSGYFEVIVDEKVEPILKEIKSWPGRNLAGKRARQLVENPIAYFGPTSSGVFDEDAIAQELASLRDAAWSWRPAIDLHDDVVASAGIHIEALGATDHGRSEVRLFSTPEGLEAFLNRADQALADGHAFFSWSSLELEVTDDSPAHLDALRSALGAWQQGSTVHVAAGSSDGTETNGMRYVISAALVLDINRYQDRIDSIGMETPYGIISIPLGRKGAWLPEDGEIRLLSRPDTGQAELDLSMDRAELESFVASVQTAVAMGSKEVSLPNGTAMPLAQAVEFVEALPKSLAQEVSDRPTSSDVERSPPQPRTGLLLKPNIESEDYVTRRELTLRPPDGAAPLLPRALRADVKLKAHQLDGLMWLQHLFTSAPDHCRGALLADDMGLGKTLQSLTLIARAREENPDLAPALVVAPVTLLENWKQEVDRFFDQGSLSLLTLYGAELKSHRVKSADIDEQLRSQNLKRFLRPGWADDAAIVLTTYETLRDYEFSFGDTPWSIVICDEAQRIKNPNALVSRAAKKLKADFCVAATGTPVENNLTDLWSLFDFIQPGLLEPLNRFNKTYRRPIEAKTDDEKQRVEELRHIIEPQILRRTKQQVARDLPEKRLDPSCRELPMSSRQLELYQAAIHAQKASAGTGASGTEILTLIGSLRRICTDPRTGAELEQPLPPLAEYRRIAPKLDWLLTTLESIRNTGEKSIIFLDRKDIQRLVQAYVREHFGFAPEIVNGETPTGGTSPDSRQRRIDRFQQSQGFNVMVLSPVAAGVGLNIQQANHVIHYMRHWNPAKEDQATDRAYRIGQERPVTVYTPIVVGNGWVSFDERLDELLDKKRSIARNMLNGSDDVGVAEFADLVM